MGICFLTSPAITFVLISIRPLLLHSDQSRLQKASKAKSSMFDRMVNQISAATTTTTASGASTTSAQAAAALMRFGGINSDRNTDRTSEEPVREEDGVLSIFLAEKMLKWHAEAIGRCVELSPSNDVYVMENLPVFFADRFHRPKNTFILLRILAEAIATSYIDIAVET